MVLTGYFVLVWNYTFKAIYKVNIFSDMDDPQFSDQLTNLLKKLKNGHRVDMGKVIHGLSDIEREIFMNAMDQKNKKQRDDFAEMIKDKD